MRFVSREHVALRQATVIRRQAQARGKHQAIALDGRQHLEGLVFMDAAAFLDLAEQQELRTHGSLDGGTSEHVRHLRELNCFQPTVVAHAQRVALHANHAPLHRLETSAARVFHDVASFVKL